MMLTIIVLCFAVGPTMTPSSQSGRSSDKKQSVFSRLGGESRVSSSSDVRPALASPSRSRSPEKLPVEKAKVYLKDFCRVYLIINMLFLC